MLAAITDGWEKCPQVTRDQHRAIVLASIDHKSHPARDVDALLVPKHGFAAVITRQQMKDMVIGLGRRYERHARKSTKAPQSKPTQANQSQTSQPANPTGVFLAAAGRGWVG